VERMTAATCVPAALPGTALPLTVWSGGRDASAPPTSGAMSPIRLAGYSLSRFTCRVRAARATDSAITISMAAAPVNPSPSSGCRPGNTGLPHACHSMRTSAFPCFQGTRIIIRVPAISCISDISSRNAQQHRMVSSLCPLLDDSTGRPASVIASASICRRVVHSCGTNNYW